MALPDKAYEEFKALMIKDGIIYETDAEYREAADNLMRFGKVVFDIALDKINLDQRLKKEPKGFSHPGEGRTCPLCSNHIYQEEMWYDKWGFKCMDCQDALNKKIIPGFVFTDRDYQKHITDSTLAWKVNLRVQTIRKLVRQGKLKATIVPSKTRGDTYVFFRKDNPDLAKVIEEEKQSKKK